VCYGRLVSPWCDATSAYRSHWVFRAYLRVESGVSRRSDSERDNPRRISVRSRTVPRQQRVRVLSTPERRLLSLTLVRNGRPPGQEEDTQFAPAGERSVPKNCRPRETTCASPVRRLLSPTPVRIGGPLGRNADTQSAAVRESSITTAEAGTYTCGLAPCADTGSQCRGQWGSAVGFIAAVSLEAIYMYLKLPVL
jgi:hypothetical protein